MSQARKLAELQALNNQIEEIQQRLQKIEEQLVDETALMEARQAAEQVEGKLRPFRTRATDLELEIDTAISKQQQTQERLYGGEVKNTKELEDMQQELASLNGRQERLEETMLELMMEIEEAETDLLQKQETLARTERARRAELEQVTAERETKRQELTRLEAKRIAVRGEIAPEHLQLHDQLAHRLSSGIVVKMKMDGVCSRCGVQQNSATEKEVRRENIVQCGNCQRILVF